MIRFLKHVYRVLFTGSSFLLFFSGGAVLAYVLLPLVRLAKGTPDEKAARCREWVAHSWIFFHDYMRFWGLIDYDPAKRFGELPPGPVVVVANHPTLVDVTALISVWGRLVCVAKSSHFRSPLVGRLLKYCGYIDGGDGGIFSSAAVVTAAVHALERGAAVMIFPEGTRSPMYGLNRFRQGAFEMAARANVPVQPVLITCDPPTLMRGQPWYDVPPRRAEMTITPLPLLRPPHGDPAECAARLEQDYRARLRSFFAEREVDPALVKLDPPAKKAG